MRRHAPLRRKILAALDARGPLTVAELRRVTGTVQSTMWSALVASENRGVVKEVGYLPGKGKAAVWGLPTIPLRTAKTTKMGIPHDLPPEIRRVAPAQEQPPQPGDRRPTAPR